MKDLGVVPLYKNGLGYGDKIRLKKKLPIRSHRSKIIGYRPVGEIWKVTSAAPCGDCWLQSPDGAEQTWTDDGSIFNYFEVVERLACRDVRLLEFDSEEWKQIAGELSGYSCSIEYLKEQEQKYRAQVEAYFSGRNMKLLDYQRIYEVTSDAQPYPMVVHCWVIHFAGDNNSGTVA